jgi:hypothetical protein
MSATLGLVPFIFSASDQQLLLKRGIYVRGKSCKDSAESEHRVRGQGGRDLEKSLGGI